jgi:hypothetical protein
MFALQIKTILHSCYAFFIDMIGCDTLPLKIYLQKFQKQENEHVTTGEK